MRINSRQKGARAERLWRDELRAQGFTARRGQQFSGSPDSPDVICDELTHFHFEVKAVEKLNIYDAMDQARRDAARQPQSLRGAPDKLSTPCRVVALAKTDQPSTRNPFQERIPIVVHKRNFRPWLITMYADTFFKVIRIDHPGGALGPACFSGGGWRDQDHQTPTCSSSFSWRGERQDHGELQLSVSVPALGSPSSSLSSVALAKEEALAKEDELSALGSTDGELLSPAPSCASCASCPFRSQVFQPSTSCPATAPINLQLHGSAVPGSSAAVQPTERKQNQ